MLCPWVGLVSVEVQGSMASVCDVIYTHSVPGVENSLVTLLPIHREEVFCMNQ